jgi:hypothetical protein
VAQFLEGGWKKDPRREWHKKRIHTRGAGDRERTERGQELGLVLIADPMPSGEEAAAEAPTVSDHAHKIAFSIVG